MQTLSTESQCDGRIMLRDRYGTDNIFDRVAVVGIAIEPVLRQLDKLLDDGLFKRVKATLATRYLKTQVMGRGSLPVEVVLRILVVKHLCRLCSRSVG